MRTPGNSTYARRPSVLIIDDDHDCGEMLGVLLESHGYRSILAADGRDALEALQVERPCLIVLDLLMPRMDGWQFRLEQLRRGVCAGVPVVVLSGVAKASQHLDVAAVLHKPVDEDELLDVLRAHCQLPSAGEQDAAPAEQSSTDRP
jgi:DNA-binding response OmpR family regulator